MSKGLDPAAIVDLPGPHLASVSDDSGDLSESNQPTAGLAAVAKAVASPIAEDIRSVSVAQRRRKSQMMGRTERTSRAVKSRKRLRVVRKTLQKTVSESSSKLLF